MEAVPEAERKRSDWGGRREDCPYVNLSTSLFPESSAGRVTSSPAADSSFSLALLRLSWISTNTVAPCHSSHFPLCHSLDLVPLAHNALLLDRDEESVSLNQSPHHLVVNAWPGAAAVGGKSDEKLPDRAL